MAGLQREFSQVLGMGRVFLGKELIPTGFHLWTDPTRAGS